MTLVDFIQCRPKSDCRKFIVQPRIVLYLSDYQSINIFGASSMPDEMNKNLSTLDAICVISHQ